MNFSLMRRRRPESVSTTARTSDGAVVPPRRAERLARLFPARVVAAVAVLVGLVLLALPFLVPYGWFGQEAAAVVSWLLGVIAVGYGGSRLYETASATRYERSLEDREPVETRVLELSPDTPAEPPAPAPWMPSRPYPGRSPAPPP